MLTQRKHFKKQVGGIDFLIERMGAMADRRGRRRTGTAARRCFTIKTVRMVEAPRLSAQEAGRERRSIIPTDLRVGRLKRLEVATRPIRPTTIQMVRMAEVREARHSGIERQLRTIMRTVPQRGARRQPRSGIGRRLRITINTGSRRERRRGTTLANEARCEARGISSTC